MKHLDRFLDAQKSHYDRALQEVQKGKKTTDWIWFVFPQMDLGSSSIAKFYSITGREEALAYLTHDILGERLNQITLALLEHTGKLPHEIFGELDSKKVKSCMTLFAAVSIVSENIFSRVLEEFYHGKKCERTIDLLSKV